MPTNPLYPVVSDILPLDKIPSELEGLRDALESVLGEVYFKDFIVGQSYHGEAAYYSMTLLSFSPLGIQIPFIQDFNLALNPNTTGNTEIPITFDYRWEVLKYINDFNFTSFNNSIASIVNILLEIGGITKEEVFNEILGSFIADVDALETFVTDFNSEQGTSIAIDTTINPVEQVTNVLNQIELNDIDFLEVIATKYIEGANFNEGLDNINTLLSAWFGTITRDSINDILKLKFNVILPNIALGLTIPRKWLVPVDNQLEPLPEPEVSLLTFNVGSLAYSSLSGFNFENTNSFSLTKSMIGNTGLIIEATGLKLDLERDSNIPEADADGRGLDFTGVYAQYAAVTLPKRWFNNEEELEQTTARLAGYDLLIGTGGVSGTIAFML